MTKRLIPTVLFLALAVLMVITAVTAVRLGPDEMEAKRGFGPAPASMAPGTGADEADPNTIGEGVHMLGEDIDPGVYTTRVPGWQTCYWSRLGVNSVLDNGNLNAGDNGRVTVAATDAGLELRGECVWAKSAGGMRPVSWSAAVTSPNKRVIEVVDKVGPTSWNVVKAVDWLDRYTASDMRLVARCSGKAYRCITIRTGKVKGAPVGWSSGSTITIDLGKANGSMRYRYKYAANRTWLLTHELGHQFGLDHTARLSKNVMNPYVNRYRMALTGGQRAALAKR